MAKVPREIGSKIFGDGSTVRISDFEIGIARGRPAGGDWGVDFVYRRFSAGSLVDDTQPPTCSPVCTPTVGSRIYFRQARMTGVAAHRFAGFTFRKRFQAGATFGGGYAQIRGNAEEHYFGYGFMGSGPTLRLVPTEIVNTEPLRKVLLLRQHMLLATIEGTFGVVVRPGLKVRVGAGMNFPTAPSFSVGAVYLFGGK